MKTLVILVTLLSAITSSAASRGFKVIEFESNDCTGWVKHANVGLKRQFWQISMDNATNSVYTSTTNDGIYRWYGFSAVSAEHGCAGAVVGRLHGGCLSLGAYNERIECVRWCSTWAQDETSCAAIGQD
ncbi:hypothetical protein GGR54DRAFT_625739 [Hypoxylon sp. NC1633]|nr:hypothetical protein GGR54DRAFT_625739 [Hypoxylon sp. NC1633]